VREFWTHSGRTAKSQLGIGEKKAPRKKPSRCSFFGRALYNNITTQGFGGKKASRKKPSRCSFFGRALYNNIKKNCQKVFSISTSIFDYFCRDLYNTKRTARRFFLYRLVFLIILVGTFTIKKELPEGFFYIDE